MALVKIEPQEIINRFKEHCNKFKGWQTYKNVNLVQVKNSYHRLIWIYNLMPGTFKSAVKDHLCTIQITPVEFEPFDYVNGCVFKECPFRTVKLQFMAWVLPKQPEKYIVKFLEKRLRLQERVALYDLSRFFDDMPIIAKLNRTKSIVFDEFEKFLISYYGAEFKDITFAKS